MSSTRLGRCICLDDLDLVKLATIDKSRKGKAWWWSMTRQFQPSSQTEIPSRLGEDPGCKIRKQKEIKGDKGKPQLVRSVRYHPCTATNSGRAASFVSPSDPVALEGGTRCWKMHGPFYADLDKNAASLPVDTRVG